MKGSLGLRGDSRNSTGHTDTTYNDWGRCVHLRVDTSGTELIQRRTRDGG